MMDPDVVKAMTELNKIDRPKNRDRLARMGLPETPFYIKEQVLSLVPISNSNLYLMMENGEFPKQIKLGKRAVVWSRKEVNDWIRDKLHNRSGDE